MSNPGCNASVCDLQAVAAAGWRATESTYLGGWLLRAAGGFTGRANSVLALGDPGLPLSDAVDHAVSWYAQRGLAGRFMLPLPDSAALDTELAARGWPLGDVVQVMVAPLAPLVAGPGDRPPVQIDAVPDAAWLAEYHYRGAALPTNGAEVLRRGDEVAFASVRGQGGRGSGPVLAIGRGSVDSAPDGTRWLGVTAVEVVQAARRTGLGGAVLRALAGWGVSRAATCCYLQVAADNGPALALYTAAGFTVHHTYQYRLAPAGP